MTIRIKLLLVFSLTIIMLSAIGLYSAQVYRNNMDHEHHITAWINATVDQSHHALSTFNTQLNAWKNILLRGGEQNNYHRYLQKFYDNERKSRLEFKKLGQQLQGLPDVKVNAERLINAHKQMGRTLRDAIRVYNDTDVNAGFVTDRYVKDIEEEPSQLLQEIIRQLENYRSEELRRLEQYRIQQEEVLIGLIVAVIFIMLTLYLWLVDRNVARPAELANYLADVIHNAQRVAKFGTWDWDSKEDRHYWSDGLYRILGTDRDQPPSMQSFLNNLHEDDRERVKSIIKNALTDHAPFEIEARVRLAGNKIRVVQLRGQVSEVKANNHVRMTSIVYDITERKESEQRLAYLANYDTLTGLPNRNLFQDRLKHAMAQSDRNRKKVGLLYLDLDHFKSVNDALGHQAGDLLLVETAERIRRHIRESDTVARLGGDEFTIILEQLAHADQVVPVAENILASLNEVYKVESQEVFVSASMGITFYPTDGEDSDTLMKNADAAMYQAKDHGRNVYYFFTEELNRIAHEKLTLKNSLRMALERDEFQLHFQPQVELATGRVVGAETLLRWAPNQNLVSPARFIPILEETGLIVKVGQWVLEQACVTARYWQQEKGYKDFRIAVNISARQLHQVDIVEVVRQALQDSGLAAAYLEIELTESTLIDESISKQNLQQLEQLGVQIAIDDFGTGYSSLNYLKKYSVDVLKIDRSFIRDIVDDKNDDAVTSAIIALSHKLDMNVIAEGIETAQQYAMLRQAGCDQAQGFFFGRPMVKHYFEQWMADYFDEEKRVAIWNNSSSKAIEYG